MYEGIQLNGDIFCFSLGDSFPQNVRWPAPQRHRHSDFEVLYEIHGCKSIEQAKDMRGSFTIMPPQFDHDASFSTEEAFYSTSFAFSIHCAGKPTSKLGKDLFSLNEPVAVKDDFHGVNDLIECSSCNSSEKIRINLLHLLSKLHGQFMPADAQEIKPVSPIKTQLIENYIWGHIGSNDDSFSELAKILYVSERQLHRILESVYHSTYRQMILNARMEMAYAYATTTNKTLDEIAELVGYNSASSLSNAYKSYFGNTFSQERKARGDSGN